MTTAGLQLEDLVAIYPSNRSEGIQGIVASKREFASQASSPTELPPPRPGTYYKHQELVGRMMQWLDRLFLFHETGTGKSCALIRVAEEFKRLREVGGHIQHVFILVKGDILVNEMKNQILCYCTGGDYITPLVLESKTETSRRANITREIGKWYTIETYGKFAKEIGIRGKNSKGQKAFEPLLSDEQIIQKYSNCLFIIDEVHNLRVIASEKTEEADDDPGLEDPEKQQAQDEEMEETRFSYAQLKRVFSLVKRSKVILASATPMINSVDEIGPLMNLILPTDNQIPTNFDYKNATVETMAPYLNGKISFVRALDTGAIPTYEGVNITENMKTKNPTPIIYRIMDDNGVEREIESQVKVEPSIMQEWEDEFHELRGQDVGYLLSKGPNDKVNAFSFRDRMSSNFVYPDNSFGNQGFKAHTHHSRVEGVDVYTPDDELRPFLEDHENLKLCGCKIARIIELCSNEPGNCFIYSDFAMAGAFITGLAFQYSNLPIIKPDGSGYFEELGYERFLGTQSVFNNKTNAPKINTVCPKNRMGTIRTLRIDPKPRYAIITRDNAAQRQTILDLFNSYENRHGDYIKVILGSPVSKEGINLANVKQVHLLGASWNPATTYQAQSRAIRSTSHLALIEEEKQRRIDQLYGELSEASLLRYERQGLSEEEIREDLGKGIVPKIEVKIYKHAALSPLKNARGGTIGYQSNDVDLYLKSEAKEIEIKRMERIMRRVAVDCQIHRKRNIRPDDVDYSPTCNYAVCNYSCSDDPLTEFLDETTYDVFYSDEEVDQIVKKLIEFFRTQFTTKVEDLYLRFPEHKVKFIDLALEKLVHGKTIIFDRYGMASYLREDGSTVFLQRNYPIVTPSEQRDKYTLNEYTSHLIANEVDTLSGALSAFQSKEQDVHIAEIKNSPADDEYFDQLVEDLNDRSKISLLEEAIILEARGETAPWSRRVLEIFQNSYYTFFEPETELARLKEQEAIRAAKTKKKAQPGTVRKIKLNDDLNFFMETDTEEVFVHSLLVQYDSTVSYARTSKFLKAEGKLMLYKPSENVGWRTMRDEEKPVYNLLVQMTIDEALMDYEKFPIYGLILHDKKFLIRDKREVNKNAIQTDGRLSKRGRECSKSTKLWQHYDLLWYFKIDPPKDSPLPPKNRKLLNEKLLQRKVTINMDKKSIEQMSDEHAEFLYQWVNNPDYKKIPICNLLEEYFREHGMLFEV